MPESKKELQTLISNWIKTARNPYDRWIDEEAYWTVRDCSDLLKVVPDTHVYIVKQLFDRVKYRKHERPVPQVKK